MLADILTKPVTREKFEEFRKGLHVLDRTDFFGESAIKERLMKLR